MSRCHVCLEQLDGAGELFHPRCCRMLFGTRHAPGLPYAWSDLNDLAREAVLNRVVIPGVQPKLSLHLEKPGSREPGRLTIVGLSGDLIMKPPVAEYPEMPQLEHLTMRLAGLFGIPTAACGLAPLASGELCYLSRRMDRSPGGKIHMEDFCQLTDNLTEQKYRGGSMEKVAKMVLQVCSNSGLDALRLFELTLFCFLTGNSDMHLKNFSVLHLPDGEIALSPAYDLLPVQILLPEDGEELALPLGGKKSGFRWRHFRDWAAGFLQLSPRQVENVHARFARALPAALELIPLGLAGEENKNRLAGLVRSRAERLHLADDQS